jgi:hypothetical protein
MKNQMKCLPLYPFPLFPLFVCVCEIDFDLSSQLLLTFQRTTSGILSEYSRNSNRLQVLKLTKFIENGRSCHTRMLRPIMLSYSKVYREAG